MCVYNDVSWLKVRPPLSLPADQKPAVAYDRIVPYYSDGIAGAFHSTSIELYGIMLLQRYEIVYRKNRNLCTFPH